MKSFSKLNESSADSENMRVRFWEPEKYDNIKQTTKGPWRISEASYKSKVWLFWTDDDDCFFYKTLQSISECIKIKQGKHFAPCVSWLSLHAVLSALHCRGKKAADMYLKQRPVLRSHYCLTMLQTKNDILLLWIIQLITTFKEIFTVKEWNWWNRNKCVEEKICAMNIYLRKITQKCECFFSLNVFL